MKLEDDVVIHNGLGYLVGQRLGVFYADYSLLGLRYPEWIQGYLKLLIGLFHKIGLMANLAK